MYLASEQVVVDLLHKLGDELGVTNVVDINVLHVGRKHMLDGHRMCRYGLLRLRLCKK